MNHGETGGFDVKKNKIVANSSKYFTLAGFMINANDILKIENSLRNVKIKYGLNPLHEVKWHTTYSKLGLNFEQYKNLKIDVIKIIRKHNNSIYGAGIKLY